MILFPVQDPPRRHRPLRKWGLPVFLTAIGIAFSVGVIFGTKPWETKVFDDSVLMKEIPLRDFTAAGWWLGAVFAGAVAFVLAGTWKYWGNGGTAAILPANQGNVRTGGRWFWPLVLGLMILGLLQRWPAMSHSFWGDEGWSYCDYIHGKWRPEEKGGSMQDAIRFRRVSWEQTVFGDQAGNNHWLATILQRLTLEGWQKLGGRSRWEFDERVVRLVPLVAGLLSLAALAGFLRSESDAMEGIVAAAFMEFHPWHIRFSAEARGYSLMLLCFILALWLAMRALRRGRVGDWLAFGVMQFLVLYSWKGALYPLAFLNLLLGGRIIFGLPPVMGQRGLVLRRWMAANLVGAMLFLPLAMPSQLQVRRTIEDVRHRARPMNQAWAVNIATETLIGMPYFEGDPENSREVSLQRLTRETPVSAIMAGVILILLSVGVIRLWRRNPFLGGACLIILVSGLAAALHFKYFVRVEFLPWYLLYCLPAWAVLFAYAVCPKKDRLAGLTGSGVPKAVPWRYAGAVSALVFFAWFETPMAMDLRLHPKEDFRGAWAVSRGAHEVPGYSGPSPIHTIWLWRYGQAYDPRGDTHIRDAQSLKDRMRQVRSETGDLYFIVGHWDLSELLCQELLEILKDPTQFELIDTLWGGEKIHTLRVYRMISKGLDQSDSSEIGDFGPKKG
jgi:hypothetical protein